MAAVYQAWTHQFQRVAEPQIKEMSKMYLDIVSEIVELGQQEGSLRKDLYLGLVKRFIIGAVDEVINTWLHAGGRYDLSSMADPLVDLFIRGIGADPGAASIPEPAPKGSSGDGAGIGPRPAGFRPCRGLELIFLPLSIIHKNQTGS